MARERPTKWHFFTNGILIVASSVGEILYSVISLPEIRSIGRWCHHKFPYTWMVRFPMQKSGIYLIYTRVADVIIPS